MPAGTLDGVAVLVTRPEHQAKVLIEAIRAANGEPIAFPAFEVLGHPPDRMATSIGGLAPADIIIFVSANAARLGQGALDRATSPRQIAAIGAATASALEADGIEVDICPASGFDSESLLADTSLQSVAGKTVTIVRGDPGRELLAKTLTERGATVQYLSAYSVIPRNVEQSEREAIEASLGSGAVQATVIMSVKTMDCLEAILSAEAIAAMGRGTLVAPGGRVIQTLQERLPGARWIQSAGVDAASIVEALIAGGQDEQTPNEQ